MANPPANLPTGIRAPARILVPKPRSMQSRFVLMEAASVVVALLLMSAVLGISLLIRSQIAHSFAHLQQRFGIHAQIQDAFDWSLVDFWKAYRQPDDAILQRAREDMKEIQALLQQGRDTSETPEESQQDAVIERLVNENVTLSTGLLDRTRTKLEATADEQRLRAIETEITATFTDTDRVDFQGLRAVDRRVDVYNHWLYALLAILGLYPIGVMVWFRRAQEKNIWGPLEQLYAMVMEVKRGNLKVKGEIPETIELGTLTAAFLSMSEELADMRDSLEEKVRVRAAQLEVANKDLVRAAKLSALGQLVAGVAHEINNPLTSILGFSEITLSNPGLSPSMRSQLQTVRSEAIRLKHLVSNLSSFSRSKPQNFSRVDLCTVGDRLLQLRSYQLAANNIKIHYARPDHPVWVNADDEQLLEVLLNLVLNSEQAIRSCREKGEIHLKCESSSGWAIFTVKDNGCGMSAGVRDNIFDPFFTTKPTGKGTGLGLSISHTIVNHHGGEFAIDSVPGKGTTVRISLPFVRENVVPNRSQQAALDTLVPQPLLKSSHKKGNGTAMQEPIEKNVGLVGPSSLHQEASDAPDQLAPRRIRILAIDDEPEILNLLSVALGRAGSHVVTLQESSQLASVLNGDSFDAVICDLKMPGLDGLAVLRALRESHPQLAKRFLLMTGNLADADKSNIELQGVPILPKPFSLGRLREMLDQLLTANN